MWASRALRLDRNALIGSLAATGAWWVTNTGTARLDCEGNIRNDERIRKRTTLKKANTFHSMKRSYTREELSKIRETEDEMLKRWEMDEDGWRELPARAWPEYQPDPEQLKGIQVKVAKEGCTTSSKTDICKSLLFNVATGFVFHNVDFTAGFQQYEELAKKGHVDSMVACGVILSEGLGGLQNREAEGVRWLKRAVALNSIQACYELGTVFYTGIDDLIDDDPEAAYELFEKAAGKGHVGALYMMADCLIEGEGTERNVARAVPLLYQAADLGHRYARQRVRELLKDEAYR